MTVNPNPAVFLAGNVSANDTSNATRKLRLGSPTALVVGPMIRSEQSLPPPRQQGLD